MQAQTTHTAYTGLWSRLSGFDPMGLSRLIEDRAVVRLGLQRATIHLVTARDAWLIRPLVQIVHDRMYRGQFGKELVGVDLDELTIRTRAFLETGPKTFKQIGDHLVARWPDSSALALGIGARTRIPLVQVPPRGLWGRSGQAAHTSIEAWLGEAPTATLSVDGLVTRYLAAFGPATVMDAQAWSGLTKLSEVFERLRPSLVTFRNEGGRELFDLPDAPRPAEDTPAPARFLYDYDNVLLSHAERSRMFSPDPIREIPARLNESISTFIVDGVVAGAWKVIRDGKEATLRLTPILRLASIDLEALVEEGRGLLDFLAGDAPTRDVIIAE
jgi:Winged helix DNA-binding domain